MSFAEAHSSVSSTLDSGIDMEKRVEHIDIAKGISITLVALFHSELSLLIPEIIDPMALFRMPLFFFLSGVFFSYSLDPKAFFLKKSEALLKPYFSILLALFLLSFLSGDGALLYQLKGIFYANGDTIRWTPLWFLTHLFSLYIFTYFLFYFCKFDYLNYPIKLVLLFVFISVGSLFVDIFWYKSIRFLERSTEVPGLPFSLDIILISSTYFIVGYLLKEKLIAFSPNVVILMFSLVTFVCVSIFTDAYINLNKRIYDDPIFATVGAAAGIYFIIYISWFLSKVKWLGLFLLRLGDASLFILIFHNFIGSKVHSYFSNIEGNLLVVAIFSFALSVIIPMIIKTVVIKSDILSLAFFPFKSNKLLQRALRL